MKKVFLLIIVLFGLTDAFSQDFEYKKDLRPQIKKEDPLNQYQTERISKTDLIHALELAGVSIHKFYLGQFDKQYTISLIQEEYKENKLVDSKVLFANTNAYYYIPDVAPAGDETLYMDYIDQLSFYSKNDGGKVSVTISSYNANFRSNLEQKIERKDQFYNWRGYSKTDWILNKQVPLLVYASSWYDEKYDFERFCGVVDLSYNEKDTQELLDSSTHYYVISYKVTE